MPDYEITTFEGLNTAVKDTKTLKKTISPDSLNWITGTSKDHIELRRGYARLGATEVTGNGKVTGMGVGVRYDGVHIPWFSYGRKVKYYDVDLTSTSAVWTIFPSRYLPLLGYYAIGIYKGAVDYDSINRAMLPENRATLQALKSAMENWDNERQLSTIDQNDPTDLYSYPRSGAINRYD